MKTIRLFSLSALCLAFTAVTFAQTSTETFKVSGVCGMCKSKIEKAAKEAGAKSAKWDKVTKDLTITYSSSSTNTAKIQQKIADVGYDNDGYKATEDAYNKLHSCCKYDRAGEEEMDACCKKDGEKTEGCCKKGHEKMDCCKDGKCSKEGHDGKDCCKKE